MGKTSFTLRPFLASDTHALRELFAQSIDVLCAEDYDEDQRAAWISAVEDATLFGQRLAGCLTILAEGGGKTLGFASLKDNTVIDMLYIHPHAAGQGIGTGLMDALERLAVARGSAALTAEVSDTALPFFTKRGFVGIHRNAKPLGDVWLSNTSMKKQLTPPPKATA